MNLKTLLLTGILSASSALAPAAQPPKIIDMGAASSRTWGGILRFGQDIRIPPGATVNGDITGIGSEVSVEGRIQGSVNVIGGKVYVNSAVDGDLNAIGSELILGPQAWIGGELYTLGGHVEQDPDAVVRGSTVNAPAMGGGTTAMMGLWAMLAWMFFWIKILAAAGWLFLAALAGFLFASPLNKTSDALQTSPGKSFLLGVAAWPLAGLVSIALLVSILGIPLIPPLVISMSFLTLWGYLGVCNWVGRKYLHAQKTWLACLLGALILNALALIPVAGKFIWFTALLFGLGASITAVVSLSIEPSEPPRPADFPATF